MSSYQAHSIAHGLGFARTVAIVLGVLSLLLTLFFLDIADNPLLANKFLMLTLMIAVFSIIVTMAHAVWRY